MQLGMFDHAQFPERIAPGGCSWCGGSLRVRIQNDGGEVRYYDCDHCNGTGVEPPSMWQLIKSFFNDRSQ